MDFQDLIKQLLTYITEAKIEKIIEKLESLKLKGEKIKTIILLKKRIKELKEKSDKGTISLDNEQAESNKITEGLIEFVQSLTEQDFPYSFHFKASDFKSEEDFLKKIMDYQPFIEKMISDSNYDGVIDFYKKIIELHKEKNFTQSRLITYYNKIARIFTNKGNYEGALKYQEDAIVIFEREVGERDLDLAILKSDLAYTYVLLDKYNLALKIYQESKEILEQIFLTDNLELGKLYNGIAIVYERQGKYDDALKFQNKAIEIFKKKLGIKNLKTATAYSNLAIIYQYMGEYNTALAFHKKAIKIQEQILNSDDINLASSYGNIAVVYGILGEYKKELEFQLKQINILENSLSPKHPELAFAYTQIGFTYRLLGKYGKSIDILQKAINILIELNIDTNLDLARAYNHIALTYQEREKFDIALDYYKKSILIREKVLSFEHRVLGESYNNIGIVYYCLREYEQALYFHDKSISIREKILPEGHIDLAQSYSNIGLVYSALEKLQEALNYFLKAIEIYEEKFGFKHSELAVIYHNIASVYQKLEKYDDALINQKKAVEIIEEVLPKNHPYQKTFFNALLELILAKGKDAFNEKDFKTALHYFEEFILYPESEDGEIWGYIADSYYHLKDYNKAIEAYKKVVFWSPEEKRKNHYQNIGIAYVKNLQFKEAKTAFAKYEKLFPEKGRTFINWAIYYSMQNQLDEAIQNLQKAVKLGYNDVEYLKTDEGFDNVRERKEFQELINKL